MGHPRQPHAQRVRIAWRPADRLGQIGSFAAAIGLQVGKAQRARRRALQALHRRDQAPLVSAQVVVNLVNGARRTGPAGQIQHLLAINQTDVHPIARLYKLQ